MALSNFLVLSPEVESAIAADKPIVALESTVIAHGLPQPQNLETALRLEQIVRQENATPATIAVIGGKLCAGLSQKQIEHLANSDEVRKISSRDLAVAPARGGEGATTFPSTMWFAPRPGFGVSATGEMGGFHRGTL